MKILLRIDVSRFSFLHFYLLIINTSKLVKCNIGGENEFDIRSKVSY